MTAAADAVLHADDDGCALVFEETLVTRAGGFVHGRQKICALGLEFREVLLQVLAALGEVGELAVGVLAGLGGGLVGGGDVLLRGLGLFHELELLVVEFYDGFLAAVNFMGQRAVFLVLLRLKLLQRVFFNLRLLGFDFQFQLLAVGLDMLHAVLGGIQSGLGTGGAGTDHLALRRNAGELALHLEDVAVAILKHEKLFDGIKHFAQRLAITTTGVNAGNFVANQGNCGIIPGKIMKIMEVVPRLLAAGLLLVAPVSRAADEAVPKSNANIDLARQLNQAFVQVAEEVSPSVVVITVLQKPSARSTGDSAEELPPELRRFMAPERTTGEGSGVIIRADGFILTNGHVVENAERIRVRLRDGRSFSATVRGVDTPSDVAVIKIDAKDLPVAKLADSSKTRVGEFAIAIGAPFALDYSVTFGHVSAKDRANILDDPENPTLLDQSFIQTDANINPGNSGGPLVNIEGEVIGINTLIRGLRTGIGFAIPANLAREISDKLISDGKYTRSWLGISITSLREDTMFRELEPGVKDGVVVRDVMPDGPAAKSQLKAADVITSIDGTAVVTSQQLKDEIRSKTPGRNVTLSVFRQFRGRGFNTNIVVQPGEWQPPPPRTEIVSAPSGAEDGTAGLKVGVLRRRGGALPGVVVTGVEPGSIGDDAGLTVGDVIVSLASQAVTTPKQFYDLLKAGDLKKGVILNFSRQGNLRRNLAQAQKTSLKTAILLLKPLQPPRAITPVRRRFQACLARAGVRLPPSPVR